MKTKIGYVICGICILVACWYPFYNVDSHVEMKEVTRIVERAARSSNLTKEDKKYVRKHYKMNEQDYQDMILYVQPALMEADEIMAVKEENKEKRTSIKQHLQQRIDDKLKKFEGYEARQSAFIKAGQVFQKGDYVFLIVHPKANEVKEEIEDLF